MKNLLSSAGACAARDYALRAMRPGAEALLLAAVALGCAQAGWSVLAPNNAVAVNSTNAERDPIRIDSVALVSPFAPEYDNADETHATAALLSGIQLSGVRMSTDPSRSGAVLTLSDGAQRAFSIGDEIGEGATLSDVGADFVLVTYRGGQQQIAMTTSPSYSFARAMMGLEPAPGAPSLDQTAPDGNVLTSATVAPSMAAPLAVAPMTSAVEGGVFAASSQASQVAVSETVISPTSDSRPDMAWLGAALAQIETDARGVSGWRLPAQLPQAAVDAGLHGGDFIVAVNGARPGDAAGLLAAVQSDAPVGLELERDGARIILSVSLDART
jgi:type II secretory pathway component PulC